eukprot:10507359-Prorocentrum_lima.AAC.1
MLICTRCEDQQVAEQTALREQERRRIEAETREVQEQRAKMMRDIELLRAEMELFRQHNQA